MIVNQWLPAAHRGDAIGDSARTMRRMLRALGHDSEIYALTIDDVQALSNRTPMLADFKPSGLYVMEDLQAVGGTPAVMKMLLAEGLLNGECRTVTGRTVAENLADLVRGNQSRSCDASEHGT